MNITSWTYSGLKNLYKAPVDIMTAIMAGMKEFNWKACLSLQELMMPAWQNRQKMYKTFSKGVVLQSLGLNSACQLLLAEIMSLND
ncbi:hypothetical protein BG003_006643 [Podila horticola]|nr:hypothetical protein BG003_006643 [Podila horticola]